MWSLEFLFFTLEFQVCIDVLAMNSSVKNCCRETDEWRLMMLKYNEIYGFIIVSVHCISVGIDCVHVYVLDDLNVKK